MTFFALYRLRFPERSPAGSTQSGTMPDNLVGRLGEAERRARMSLLSSRGLAGLLWQAHRLSPWWIRGGRFTAIVTVFAKTRFQFLDTCGEDSNLLLLRLPLRLHRHEQSVNGVRPLVVEGLKLVTSEHTCFHDSN